MQSLQQRILRNTRFGEIAYEEEDVLSFPEGLIGFPDLSKFLLLSTSDTSSFRWLQSLDTPSLAFLVIDPTHYVRDYAPPGIPQTDHLILTTANIPTGMPQEMTLNLAGPIVVDVSERTGWQTVLDGDAYTTRYRVFASASAQTGEIAA